MKLQGLKFYGGFNGTEGDTRWPEREVITDNPKHESMYSPAFHTIFYQSRFYSGPNYGKMWLDNLKNISDIRPLTDKELKQLGDVYAKKELTAANAKKKREFDKAVIGDTNLINDRLVRRFLNGEVGDPDKGSGLSIFGDDLKYYGGLLLRRIGKNEYLLGRDLTSLSQNTPACSSRTLAVLQQYSDIITWPTMLTGWKSKEKISDPYLTVAEYVKGVLMVCQLRMPTARDKESYHDIFYSAKNLYIAANNRWHKITPGIEELIDMYGDIPKMKEFNTALRMQFEMTGGVGI